MCLTAPSEHSGALPLDRHVGSSGTSLDQRMAQQNAPLARLRPGWKPYGPRIVSSASSQATDSRSSRRPSAASRAMRAGGGEAVELGLHKTMPQPARSVQRLARAA
jgi:hypothetical protein